ncbi:helix-turn-helix transcriptional regulator [Nocardia cyriacigeorgica]|uniref:Helix-turn-helix transcriptional regulator n=1 Tax=Nocardia cyriacigeorgica TaxID=135487 RepID=A0A6P1DAH9_9NOCA|nr:LuxR C-terminal-related transcriptional regulator [Nocardia cyriacigeorgica]NEW38691.1 helix-turn-helix transcriptional regulator [Nocardia cyriacigeorgica]NEW46551.1 helix-turn-helix transcriptional regulator [Nocardia cyriacigeorgica]NEW53401.1 helix-turn-helix transcriptional regulator [Nocardia cyriacigeorgica]NEW59067.1 helix-turn-helix transcriptional regulator [Nocardia cyriacigeorgica]
MAEPVPPAAFETLPCARELFRELDSDDPVVHLIRGRSGTGKSTLLAAVRARLRERGVPVFDTTRRTGFQSGAALVVDNLDALGHDELEKLRVAIESGGQTVVAAGRPRHHDPELRALFEAALRRGRVAELRPLGVAEIAPFARELGMSVPRAVAAHIHKQTDGIRGGVVAALSAACTARLDASIAAVDAAVDGWARTVLADIDPALLDTLAVATTGSGLDAGELTEVLGVAPAKGRELIDRARATALITDADLLLAPAVEPLRALLGERRFLTIQRDLLTARLNAGLLRDHTAVLLAESGLRDRRLADFLCTAAGNSGNEAVRYYAAAARAGADRDAIAVLWAEAAALACDYDTALRLAEPLLARDDVPVANLAAAVRICASVLTRRGLTERAARLYAWLGPDRAGAEWAEGAAVLYLSGDAAAASSMAANASRWAPTESNAPIRLVTDALGRTLRGRESETANAISTLVRATHTDPMRFAPCTPTAAATLLCLSTGDPARAVQTLRRATGASRQSPVLSAWAALAGGDETGATTILAGLDWAGLDIRDALLAHAAAVGLARRGGDQAALTHAWQAAQPLLDEVEADLLSLLPIGELWLASIRLDDERRTTALVDAARALLERLGNPPAWSNLFHWYGVQAAIARERPDELLPHAHALKAAAEAGDRHAATLADAGRTWVLVLRGQVCGVRVESAVAELGAIGLSWDAARLAGEAALAASDSATATALLKLARTVRADARPSTVSPAPPGRRVPAAEASTDELLSDREREVAELVLLGLTYREIGARLYISAKTVEHHVARIRRRLGAGSRSELLAMLRAMGYGSLLV